MTLAQIAIRVDGLGKRYRIGQRTGYGMLRDSIMEWLHSTRNGASEEAEDVRHIWALKDVSFEVRRGEVLGLIGSNGSGKSTLLKILSRVTQPTSGAAEIHGRVGSLLEVGTGFHPELTGRENVYLNGAILGLARIDIQRRFDQIVAFSEVGKFIDTPVKFYSSGMHVRLAFAVAAHLDPEIMLVDEVLAVGDLTFQARCLGEMKEISSSGRTVLFVSHNLASIRRLCDRVGWLANGRLVSMGSPEETIECYVRSAGTSGSWEGRTIQKYPEDDSLPMQVTRLAVCDEQGVPLETGMIETGSPLVIRLDYTVRRPVQSAYFMAAVTASGGGDLLWTYDGDTKEFGMRRPGRFVAEIPLPAYLLPAGRYRIRCAIVDTNKGPIMNPTESCGIHVEDTSSLLAHRNIQWPGVVRLNPKWQTRSL